MEVLIKYIVADKIIHSLIGDNVFLIEKPTKRNTNNYVIYRYKELHGGSVKDYTVEFNIIGKDISKLLAVKDRLIDIIDDPTDTKIIKDDNVAILRSHLINGGGMIKNPETGNYHIIIFFKITI